MFNIFNPELHISNLANNRYAGLFLFTFVLLVSIINLFFFKGIELSDQYFYTKNAYLLSTNNFELEKTVFANRMGVLIPTALFIKLFTFNPYVATIWPLLTYFALLVITWFIIGKENRGIAFWAILFLSVNPLIYELSLELLPDLPFFCFSSIAILLLYQRSLKQLLYGALSALLMGFAFWTKETTVYLYPWFGILLLLDIYNRKNFRFHLSFITVSLLFTIVHFGYYFFETGEILYRFSAIEAEHNLSPVWSYFDSSLIEILSRLTYGPLTFLLFHYKFSFLIVVALLITIYLIIQKNTSPFAVYFSSFFIYLIVLFWFGSTSLKSWNPLPLVPRMWISLLLPAALLVSSIIQKGFNFTDRKPLIFLLVILVTLLILIFFNDATLSIIMGIISILLMTFLLFQTAYARTILLSFMLLPLSLTFSALWYNKYVKITFFDEKEMFLNGLKYNSTLMTDRSLASKYDIFYNYNVPDSISIMAYSNVKPKERWSVYINSQRNNTLETLYHIEVPDWIKDQFTSNTPVYRKKDIYVFHN